MLMTVFCGDDMIRSFLYVPAACISLTCFCKIVRKFCAAVDDFLRASAICGKQRPTVGTTSASKLN